MPIIKNIIFDLGGPIVNLDYQRTAQAFQKLGAPNFNALYSQAKQTDLFDLYETGKISSADFRLTLKETLNIHHITDIEFDQAWSAMVIDLPKERLDYIKNINTEYRVFLYSNTNEIHIQESFKAENRVCDLEDLTMCFEKAYFSHTFGYRKPHPESFLKLLAENNLVAHETLFIDDTLQHIEGAQQAGLHMLHLINGLTIYDVPEYIEKTINKA